MIILCQCCGQTFRAAPSSARKYCSQTCSIYASNGRDPHEPTYPPCECGHSLGSHVKRRYRCNSCPCDRARPARAA